LSTVGVGGYHKKDLKEEGVEVAASK